jgi:hypothetical protein
LEDDDFPDWPAEVQKDVFRNRYPIWCALYNKIRKRVVDHDEDGADCDNAADDSFNPMKPVSTLKHFQQD